MDSVRVSQSLLDHAKEESSINIGDEESNKDSGPSSKNKLISGKFTSVNPPIKSVKGKYTIKPN